MAYTYEQLRQLPEFAALQANEGQSYATHGFGAYDPTALQGALSAYSLLDSSTFGNDMWSNALKSRSFDFGDKRAVSATTLSDFQKRYGEYGDLFNRQWATSQDIVPDRGHYIGGGYGWQGDYAFASNKPGNSMEGLAPALRAGDLIPTASLFPEIDDYLSYSSPGEYPWELRPDSALAEGNITAGVAERYDPNKQYDPEYLNKVKGYVLPTNVEFDPTYYTPGALASLDVNILAGSATNPAYHDYINSTRAPGFYTGYDDKRFDVTDWARDFDKWYGEFGNTLGENDAFDYIAKERPGAALSLGVDPRTFAAVYGPAFGISTQPTAYDADIYTNTLKPNTDRVLNQLRASNSEQAGRIAAHNQHAASDDGFGGILQLAMLAAAIYSGGASLGAWGAGAEGALGSGFIDAIGSGIGAGAEISGALGATGGGLGADIITGGLAETGLTAADIAAMGSAGTSAGTGITGVGAIDSALNSIGNYLTNPATLERAALNAGQQLLTTGDVDPEKILLNTGMGAVGAAAGNLTSGLTDIPLLDKAIATAGTGVVFGQDPTQALLNAGIGAAGSLAGSTVGGMDIGGAGSLTDKYLPGLASVLTGTALRGGDLESAVTNYIVSTGVQAGSAELKNIVKDILPAVEAQLTSSAAVDPSVMGFEDGYATDGAVSEAADAGAGTEPTTEEPTTEAPTTEEPTTDGETQLTPEEVDAELQRVLEENPNVYTPPTQAEIDAWVAGDATWVDKAVNQVVNYASSQLKKALSPAAVKSFLTAQFAPTPRTTATPQGAVSDATDSTFSGSAPRKKEEGDEMSDAQIAELAAKMGVTPSEVKIILAQSRKKA